MHGASPGGAAQKNIASLSAASGGSTVAGSCIVVRPPPKSASKVAWPAARSAFHRKNLLSAYANVSSNPSGGAFAGCSSFTTSPVAPQAPMRSLTQSRRARASAATAAPWASVTDTRPPESVEAG